MHLHFKALYLLEQFCNSVHCFDDFVVELPALIKLGVVQGGGTNG